MVKPHDIAGRMWGHLCAPFWTRGAGPSGLQP